MAPRHRDGPRPQPLYIATSNQFVRYKFNGTEPNSLGRIMFCARGSVGVPMNILHSPRRDQVLIDARRIKFSYPQNEHIVFVAAWEEYKAKAWVRCVVLSSSRPQITHGEIATIYAELYWESLREIQARYGNEHPIIMGHPMPVTFDQLILISAERTDNATQCWQAVFAIGT